MRLGPARSADPAPRLPVTLMAVCVAVVLAALAVTACGPPENASAMFERLAVATTTSTDNSGLLAKILPEFTLRTGVEVDVIAVGTGRALELGRNADVDVVLVHAPERELEFVAQGHGVNRRHVMYNDFVVVGPRADPAGIAGAHDVARALATLAESGATFVSRGDDSGTHIKELSLWRDAGLVPDGAWYNEAGQGMGGVITMASEMQAYTLADRGTWLAMSDQVDLAVIVEGDTRLFNPYGVIAVDPVTHPDTHYLEAMLFVAWLTSPEGRSSISEFTVNGQVLFHPAETAE